ncbi:MAG: hypothetical protein ACO1TE_27880 [Prosthecobacter sp.]
MSGPNSREEIQQKVMLYFAHGAREVWTCDDQSRMTFYVSPTQTMEKSAIFAGFPAHLQMK